MFNYILVGNCVTFFGVATFKNAVYTEGVFRIKIE